MSKLPTIESSRDTQLLEKGGWDRGAIEEEKKGWVPKFKNIGSSSLSAHIKLVITLIVLIFVLIGIYATATHYLPNLLKNKVNQEVSSNKSEIPIDLSKVHFPSESNKKTILEAASELKNEINSDRLYQIHENIFIAIYNYYSADHSPDNRLELEKYRDFIKKEYFDKYESRKDLYDFTCLDVLCGKKNYPAEVVSIKTDLEKLAIDQTVKSNIIKNFETAVSLDDKNQQAGQYVNILSSLSSEFDRTKNEDIRPVFEKLLAFIKNNYQDARIPEQVHL